MRRSLLSIVGFVVASLCISACSGTAAGPRPQPFFAQPPMPAWQALAPNNMPMLVAFDNTSGRIVFWPMKKGGGSHPTPLSPPLGLTSIAALAGIGDTIAMAQQFPAGVVLYDLKAQTMRSFPDPFGVPLDIAVGKDLSIYVVNAAHTGSSVTWYQPPAHKPVELVCGVMPLGESVAVDNEGDIFEQGYGRRNAFVAEIPNGPNGPEPQDCVKLPLRTNMGYTGGIVTNPANDDLITLDDPDLCAGGREGRVTTYPKPYNADTAKSRVVGYNCSGGLRINADATRVFFGDTDVSESFFFILQRGYPNGEDEGIYHGLTSGLTTIPNTLPN